jgi:hypothetical protein
MSAPAEKIHDRVRRAAATQPRLGDVRVKLTAHAAFAES